MQQPFRLLILLIQPYMFRATNSPILRSNFLTIYSFWYNAPTLLPTGATVEMELVMHGHTNIKFKWINRWQVNEINCEGHWWEFYFVSYGIGLGEVGVGWIELAQDRDSWRALVNTAYGPGRPIRFAAHRQPLCWNSCTIHELFCL